MSIYYDIEERREIEAAVKECLRRSWRQAASIRFAVRRRDDDSRSPAVSASSAAEDVLKGLRTLQPANR